MADYHPARYEEILGWLAGHSPATVDDISRATRVTRSRALLVLRAARRNGDARSAPFSQNRLYPVQWSRTGSPPAVPQASEVTMDGKDRMTAETILRGWFRNWLADLDDGQLAALEDNWENVMNDAALDRVDAWVIADAAIAKLREPDA